MVAFTGREWPASERLENWREARDATIELLLARSDRDGEHDRHLKFLRAMGFSFGRNVVFSLLIGMYRSARKLSRAQLRQRLDDGTFWEDFLAFLQSVDWAELIKVIMEIVSMIITMIG